MQYSGKITLNKPNSKMIRSDFINHETAVEVPLRKTNLNKQYQNQNKKNVIASFKLTQTKYSVNKYSNYDLRPPPSLSSNSNKMNWKISQQEKKQDIQRQQRRKREAQQFQLESKKTDIDQRRQIKSKEMERKKYYDYIETENSRKQRQNKAKDQQYKRRYEQFKKEQQRLDEQRIKNQMRQQKLRLERQQRKKQEQRRKQLQNMKALEKERQRQQQMKALEKERQRYQQIRRETKQKLQKEKRQQDQRKQEEKKLQEKKEEEKRQSYKLQYKSTKLGLIGLNNIGNTCYMNSILQCLFNLPNFNNYFITSKYLQNLRSNGRVAQAYAKLVNLIKNTVSSSENPSTLKQAVGSRNYQFASYKQQDAHEFLICLLELMSQDLKTQLQQKFIAKNANTLQEKSNQQWNKQISKQNSYINSNFCGQLLTSIECQSCGYKIISFDNFWDIQLCFQKSKASSEELTKMLENYIKKESLQQYRCEKCQRKDNCVKQNLFTRLPPILVIHFKRFQYDLNQKGFKICNPVTYHSELQMLPYLDRQFKNQKAQYTLCGIVKHSGTLDYGHYKAQCKNLVNNKWYEFNDSQEQLQLRF